MDGPKSEDSAAMGNHADEPVAKEVIDAEALARLVQSLGSKPDQGFLAKVVKDAAEVVGADIAFISRFNHVAGRMRSLALFDREADLQEIVCDFAGTPCQAVLQKGAPCVFPTNVAEQFPKSQFLTDMGIAGYIGVPLFGVTGDVLGLFCTMFKSPVENPKFVTASLQLFGPRIALEIERAEAEERVQLALSGAADGIWDWDLDSNRAYFTPEFLQRVGLDMSMLPELSKDWANLAHDDDRANIDEAFRRHIVNDELLDVKCRLRIGIDKYLWVRLTGKAQRNSEGRAVRLLGTISDVDDLVRAQHEAEAANESKSAFLANMSHEIRTPMNAIMGMLQVLSGSEVSIEQKDWIDTAYGAAASLLTVLNDILDLSRLEAGKVEIVKEPFEVRAFMSEIESVFTASAADKYLVYETSISSNVPAQLNTDAARVRQILVNFISNAIKFTDAGKVKVSLDVTNTRGFEALEISVRDTGEGISPELQKRLFERFEQGDMSTTRRHGGTGLGLAICRELAMRLEALVGVDSVEEEGSCFWLALPMWLAEEEDTETKSQKTEQLGAMGDETPLAGIHALVAEDNIVNQRILKLLLTAFGAEVTVVSDGVMALERVQHEVFDVVLMDVSMPGMTGYDATKAIRSLEGDASAVPIIAVTAHAMGGDADRAMEAGMNGYVPKPIAAETLIDEIRTVLEMDSGGKLATG